MMCGAVACFALGWWIGHAGEPSDHRPRSAPTTPAPKPSPRKLRLKLAPSANPGRPKQKVRVHIDAGAIRLLPDASLHFGPMPALGLDGAVSSDGGAVAPPQNE